jgi:urease accessory protein UreE
MTTLNKSDRFRKLGPEHSTYKRDTITLAWEDRRQGHGRRTSDSGIEFAISLPDGSVLKKGDCFVLDQERAIVAVEEAVQPVYVIRPRTSQEWAYYAYHVGNRHQSVMIGESELIFLQNPAVRSLLASFMSTHSTDARPFTACAGQHWALALMTPAQLLHTLQLTDSLFPVRSFRLFGWTRIGGSRRPVHDADSPGRWLDHFLTSVFVPCEGLALLKCMRAAERNMGNHAIH